jgi:4,5-dihydroxyphthalate decarboxylase
MARLALSVAVGDYDRTRALIDGAVPIDGVDPVFLALAPEEIFFRAFRHAEFDICELSLSSFAVKTAQGENPYVGVPVFPSRTFRHNAIYVRTDRIRAPADLKGRRIGLPEYQLTANVWARALLEEDHGVAPADVIWVRGGIAAPGRPEKIGLALPPDIRLEDAPAGATISGMLERGEIDAFLAPRPPTAAARAHPDVGLLFRDPMQAAADYFRRTRIFPIMHMVGVRRTLAERHPWLCATVLKAFEAAKTVAVARLADTAAPVVSLPFLEEQLAAARELMGDDFWPYGVAANRHVLQTFLRHHHRQGLSPRELAVEELFHLATLEAAKI